MYCFWVLKPVDLWNIVEYHCMVEMKIKIDANDYNRSKYECSEINFLPCKHINYGVTHGF